MSDTVKTLPVFQTVGDSIKYTIKNIGLMVQLVWFWALLITVVSAIVYFAGGGEILKLIFLGMQNPDFSWSSNDVVSFAAVFLLYLIASWSVVVGWHRALLLDERPGALHATFGKREIHYFLRILAMSVVGAVLLMAIVALMFVLQAMFDETSSTGKLLLFIGVTSGFLGLVLLSMRFTLVFPGAAVGDRRVSFRTSFAMTRGNSWRMFGGFVLIGLFQFAVSLVLIILAALILFPFSGQGFNEWILSTSQAEQGGEIALQHFLFSSVQFLFSLVFAFFAVSYMSYCYWFFVPPPGQDDLAQ